MWLPSSRSASESPRHLDKHVPNTCTVHTIRALVKFDISNNKLFADGGKALAEALKGNNVMQELIIAENLLRYNSSFDSDMSGVIAVSDAIPTMGALAKFTFSGQVGRDEGSPVTIETSMVEADFSGKKLGVSGATMLATFLPKCQ